MSTTPSLRTTDTAGPTRRRGNTLVITVMMTVVVVGLVGLASQHLAGNQALQQVESQHQRAQFAAESFIALIEGRLYTKAANQTENLKKNLTDEPANWFGLRGFDAGGQPNGSATSAIYLDGCALRWRLEPVKIMASTNTPSTDPDAKFFINSERDTTKQEERREEADPSGGHLLVDEAEHFHFRVVVESYALKDPSDVTSLPWTNTGAGTHTAMAQAQRVVQFEDINAFRYMFNYIANDHTGDLEVISDQDITVAAGGLHSNERIFLSGPSTITIGPASDPPLAGEKPVAVEADSGIFALDKRTMYQAGVTNTGDAKPVSESRFRNGGGNIVLDGQPLTPELDTRLNLSAGYADAVKDGVTRALEPDLSTYQTWFGSFLGASLRAGIGSRVYQFDDGTYTRSKNGNPWHGTETPDEVAGVYLTDLPLFYFPYKDNAGNLTNLFLDVWPVQAGVPGNVTLVKQFTIPGTAVTVDFHADTTADIVDSVSGLTMPPPRQPSTNPPTKQQYLKPFMATQGYFRDAIGENSTRQTGLVIRERGRAIGGMATPRPKWDTARILTEDQLDDYNDWMRANYIVYLGRRLDLTAINGTPGWVTVDITTEFFDFSRLAVATLPGPRTTRDLMAHEDAFTNQREQTWFAARGQPAAKANVLTLNIAKVLAFLDQPVATTTSLDPLVKYSAYFNRYIYLERNARYLFDVAGATPYADPLVARSSDGNSDPFGPNGRILNISTGPMAQLALPPAVGTVDGGADPLLVRGQGQWTTYPNLRGVRIDHATNASVGNAPSRSFSVVTPNTCYLWGNFNTAGGDNPPPCGIFADSLVALSNAWEDIASAGQTLPQANDTRYQAAFVTHNVPTDRENAPSGGSGGVLNVLRLLEDWSGSRLSLYGAVVVAGRADYTRSPINRESDNQPFSSAPTYEFKYNPTLLSGNMQPRGTVKNTYSKRVLSNVIGTSR